MPRVVFATNLVGKLIMWGLVAYGLSVAAFNLIDGQIVLALVQALVIIPIALFLLRIVLGFAVSAFACVIALLTGRTHELREFTNLQMVTLAIMEKMGHDKVTLRVLKALVRVFDELPPPRPGDPPRSGAELIDLANAVS